MKEPLFYSQQAARYSKRPVLSNLMAVPYTLTASTLQPTPWKPLKTVSILGKAVPLYTSLKGDESSTANESELAPPHTHLSQGTQNTCAILPRPRAQSFPVKPHGRRSPARECVTPLLSRRVHHRTQAEIAQGPLELAPRRGVEPLPDTAAGIAGSVEEYDCPSPTLVAHLGQQEMVCVVDRGGRDAGRKNSSAVSLCT